MNSHGRAHPVHDAPRLHQGCAAAGPARCCWKSLLTSPPPSCPKSSSTTNRPAPSGSRPTLPTSAAPPLPCWPPSVGHPGRPGRPLRRSNRRAGRACRVPAGSGDDPSPGKSAFPENHPLALGAGGPSTTAMVNKYLHGADTVFGVGASLTKSFFAVPIEDNKTFVHLTNDEDAIGREYKCNYPLLGDAKLVLRQLIDEVKQRAGASAQPTTPSRPTSDPSRRRGSPSGCPGSPPTRSLSTPTASSGT